MEGLERVEKLLAALLLHDMQDAAQVEKALLLDRVGFAPSEIAELLGTSRNTISVALSNARKRPKRRIKSAKKKATKKRAGR